MTRVLITGISGSGKSTVMDRLRRKGYRAIDTDYGGWCGPADGGPPPAPEAQPGWIWRADRMEELLSGDDPAPLFVSGCVENQGAFYPRFDHVVLLTAPEDVIVERLSTRDTNDYGKAPEDRARILAERREVEPLLRGGATVVVDTDGSPDETVAALERLVL
ncbi:MAG TPA: AAA family ATPase [Stackebrandtia sp.]|jgi:dephospho-CoA kinase|uniref:AAA family ATPase n=1 Tax=Stackebrandtia sp. TaxID=2023065 RepID=UPI002D423CCE|nr:AAA family ATPase [Stackebrandtia sp.]HZE37563.1 AAA family ATPase [Stackebrandtia sp.]